MSRRSSSFRRWLAIPLLGVALSLVVAGSAQATYSVVTKWGGHGDTNGRFDGISGVATANGSVYAGDFHNYRVQKFSDTGVFANAWPTGSVVSPYDVAVAGNAYYVPVCTFDAGIEKYNATTGALTGSFGPDGEGNGQLACAEAVTTNRNGSIVYVADTGNDRIQMFSPSGAWYGKWGTFGHNNGQFSGPGGVATAPNGNVYVADTHNARIQEFTADGTFIKQWAIPGDYYPTGIAVDSHGFVYVAAEHVFKYTATGKFLEAVGAAQIYAPEDVAVDTADNVYIADGDNDQVQKFAFVKKPPHSILPPKISGQPHVGSNLTCKPGTWSGSLPIAYSYKWFRNGSQIAGATTSRYEPKSADKGKQLKCQVTGKNAYGTATSKQSAGVTVT